MQYQYDMKLPKITEIAKYHEDFSAKHEDFAANVTLGLGGSTQKVRIRPKRPSDQKQPNKNENK